MTFPEEVLNGVSCPLVQGILGKAHWTYQVSYQEDTRPQSCNTGESSDHSSRGKGSAEQLPIDSCLCGFDPITPSHLPHGRSIVSLPYHTVEDVDVQDPMYGEDDLRKRTKAQALLFKHFWSRWQREYLRECHRSTGPFFKNPLNYVCYYSSDRPKIKWQCLVNENCSQGC